MKAVAFDLGDTLVEYYGVPLSWEEHYPDDARASLAAVVSANINPQHIDAGVSWTAMEMVPSGDSIAGLHLLPSYN